MASSFAEFLRRRVGREFEFAGYRFGRAESEAECTEAFRLRHQVYAEQGFIEPEEFPAGLLRDEFDAASIQLTARQGERLIGATRLVLPSALGLPTQRLFDVVLPAIPAEHLGEFSRLAIVGDHRGENRVPMLGLIRMMFECMIEERLTHLCAFMPDKLIESFGGFGPVDIEARPPRPETLARRRPLRGYFASGDVRPVLFSLEFVRNRFGG